METLVEITQKLIDSNIEIEQQLETEPEALLAFKRFRKYFLKFSHKLLVETDEDILAKTNALILNNLITTKAKEQA